MNEFPLAIFLYFLNLIFVLTKYYPISAKFVPTEQCTIIKTHGTTFHYSSIMLSQNHSCMEQLFITVVALNPNASLLLKYTVIT